MSAAVLGEMATAVEEFLDQVLWPAPSASVLSQK